MEGGSAEYQKTEEYLATLMQSGQEVKTETTEVPVTPAEEARAAAIEAIKANGGAVEVSVAPEVKLEQTRDFDTIAAKLEGIIAQPKAIEEAPTDEIDAAAASIQERVIPVSEVPVVMPAAPQPGMMEQPQQQQQGNSRNDQMRKWGEVAAKVVRGGKSERVEREAALLESAAEVPVSAPQAAAEVVPVQQVEATSVETPATIPQAEIMMPPEKRVPLMTDGPEQDGELRAPQYGTSNQETLDGTQIAHNTAKGADIEVVSVQPKDVEMSLAKGEKVIVPEPVVPAPVVEKAPAAVVVAPKETPPVVEASKTPEPTPAAEKPKVEGVSTEAPKTKEEAVKLGDVVKEVGRGYLRQYEALASAFVGKEVKFSRYRWEGMDKALNMQPLSSGAKRFVRSLYTSQPANAVRALGWRMSIGFNDKLANYFGEQASMRGSDRERTEALLTRVKTKQQQEADEMKEFGERFKGAGITPDVAKQSEQERIAHEKAAKGLKAIAEVRGKEEIKLKGKEGTFIERRNKAAEKLEAYVGERLKPFESKLEAIRATKEKMDGELGGIQTMRDRLQVERDRVVAEKERMNMASKPKSTRMAWEELVRNKEEQLAHIDDLMKVRAGRRATLETRSKEINEEADKIRPVLEQIKNIPKQIRVSERPRPKIELPAEPVDEKPSVAEEMEKFEIETGVRHEPIPDMTTTEFIEVWNTYAGADIPLNAADLSAFMGVEQNKEIDSEELMTKLTDLLTAMTKDKNKKRLRVSQEVVMANLKPFRTYLRIHHS